MDNIEMQAEIESLREIKKALELEIHNLKITNLKQQELITSLFLKLGDNNAR